MNFSYLGSPTFAIGNMFYQASFVFDFIDFSLNL
jgi:hypothetical protein